MTRTTSVGRWGLSLLLSTALVASTFPVSVAVAAPQSGQVTCTFVQQADGKYVPQGSCAPAPEAASATSGGDPGYIMLDGVPQRGTLPLGVRPMSFGVDTPVMTKEQFFAMYPVEGMGAYNRIRAANQQVCGMANDFLDELMQIDQVFKSSQEEYKALQELYEHLPSTVKRATAVMTIAQAGTAGALCALSAGLYCIAALASAGGNVMTAFSSRSLQLANIKLSIANIRVTNANIRLNRVSVRLNAWWINSAIGACQKTGYLN